MGKIISYKDLIVWQRSIQLVKEIYLLTKLFPKDETFGLISQMKRAVVSIPSNIAEGFGRRSIKEHNQFCLISYGSALELETQIIIAIELGFISEKEAEKANSLLNEVIRMLNIMTLPSRS